VDPKAEFLFVDPGEPLPAQAEPYDMPNVRYGHRGRDCTFETALKEHRLEKDPGLAATARIVHDIDLHEMELPESAGIDALLRGLKLAEKDDQKVLAHAFVLFDALYAWARERGA
jgi:hypothetical protein